MPHPARARRAAAQRLRRLAAALLETRRRRPPAGPHAGAELRVLVVCHGNICRSAMAHGILRARLAAAGLAGRVAVDSAGTSAANAGRHADPRARLVVARHGGTIGDLRARMLADADFEAFDLILVMDERNRRDVLRRAPAPGAAAKVRRLLDDVGGGEVRDPVDGSRADFERAYAVIDRACAALVDTIRVGS